MDKTLIEIPQMLMIGSTGRNSGKTTLAVEAIKRFKSTYPIIGLKVTSVEASGDECPRGGMGCGACSNLSGHFELKEELNRDCVKDTSQLLVSGCDKVYWLKVLRTHLDYAIKEFLEKVPAGAVVVCESNSLRHVVKPGAFVMLDNEKDIAKDTAKSVMDMVDAVISKDIRDCVEQVLDAISVLEEKKGLRIKYETFA